MNVTYQTVLSLMNDGDDEGAETLLLRAIKFDNPGIELLDLYTYLLQKMNKWDLAGESAATVIEHGPVRPLYYFRASEICFRLQRHLEAFYLALAALECKTKGDGPPAESRIVRLAQDNLHLINCSMSKKICLQLLTKAILGLDSRVMLFGVLPVIDKKLIDKEKICNQMLVGNWASTLGDITEGEFLEIISAGYD